MLGGKRTKMITIISLTILAAIIITNFLSIKFGIKLGSEGEKKSVLSIFDQQKDEISIKIFHNHLENTFLRYLHKRLLGYESGTMPITNFLEEMTDRDKAAAFVTGYTVLVQSQMSDELKKIFLKYYSFEEKNAIAKKASKDAYQTTIFDKYLLEWATLRIRKLTAEFVTALGNTNLSQKHAIEVNAQLFTTLELHVYNAMGMIDLTEKTEPKQIKKSLMT
jgi:hypothetical protein